MQFTLCVIAALVYASKNQNLSDNAWYLDTQWESGISNFLSSLGVVRAKGLRFGKGVLRVAALRSIVLVWELALFECRLGCTPIFKNRDIVLRQEDVAVCVLRLSGSFSAPTPET